MALQSKKGVKINVIKNKNLIIFSVFFVVAAIGFGIFYDSSFARHRRALEPEQQGDIYAKHRQYDQAIAAYTEALQIDPQYVEVYVKRGVAHNEEARDKPKRAQAELNLAIADYNAALRINPQSDEAYRNRGLAYKKRGQHDEAMTDYNTTLRINPQSNKAYNDRGKVYASKGQWKEAIADYTAALHINPNPELGDADEDVYFNRGLAYGTTGQWEQAIADYEKARRTWEAYVDPDSVGDLSLSYIGHGLLIRRQLAQAYFFKGEACEKLGQRSQALDAYRRSQEYVPSNASEWIERLKQKISALGG